jgi:hypothetical protein
MESFHVMDEDLNAAFDERCIGAYAFRLREVPENLYVIADWITTCRMLKDPEYEKYFMGVIARNSEWKRLQINRSLFKPIVYER